MANDKYTWGNQEPDDKPGPYYVTVKREDGKFRLLAGPYAEHKDALADVDMARKIAEELDRRAIWYAFGTARMKDGYDKPGILNDLGKMPAAPARAVS